MIAAPEAISAARREPVPAGSPPSPRSARSDRSRRRSFAGGARRVGSHELGAVARRRSPERRVVVLEADTIQRASTERLLRREDFWVVASSDPCAVLRMAAVSATDVILVELSLGLLEAVPRWQRRRGDVVFRGVPAGLTDGYAVLRPLALDPTCARFPVVTLRHDPAPPSRGSPAASPSSTTCRRRCARTASSRASPRCSATWSLPARAARDRGRARVGGAAAVQHDAARAALGPRRRPRPDGASTRRRLPPAPRLLPSTRPARAPRHCASPSRAGPGS